MFFEYLKVFLMGRENVSLLIGLTWYKAIQKNKIKHNFGKLSLSNQFLSQINRVRVKSFVFNSSLSDNFLDVFINLKQFPCHKG